MTENVTNILSIKQKAAQDQERHFAHLDMNAEMIKRLAVAIKDMRDLGASSSDIAAVLAAAVRALSA